jgi:glycosyltransferase involved in cell wall biosynthesis
LTSGISPQGSSFDPGRGGEAVTSPRVSVILSVHDGEAYLGQVVASVFQQAFTDFEFIVIDDGSTDRTPEILGSFRDPRIVVISQPHEGLTVSLNRAIKWSRGELIARMDADDVALPERLARQVAYLDAHSEVGLLGTGSEEITPSGEVVATVVPPATDSEIRQVLIRRNPFVHSSVMARRGLIERAGGYDERLPVAQDYDLWMRMAALTRMANLPEPLVRRRLLPGRVSRARDSERLRAEIGVKWRALRRRVYPWWCAVFLVKPLIALALPVPLRERARGTFR